MQIIAESLKPSGRKPCVGEFQGHVDCGLLERRWQFSNCAFAWRCHKRILLLMKLHHPSPISSVLISDHNKREGRTEEGRAVHLWIQGPDSGAKVCSFETSFEYFSMLMRSFQRSFQRWKFFAPESGTSAFVQFWWMILFSDIHFTDNSFKIRSCVINT